MQADWTNVSLPLSLSLTAMALIRTPKDSHSSDKEEHIGNVEYRKLHIVAYNNDNPQEEGPAKQREGVGDYLPRIPHGFTSYYNFHWVPSWEVSHCQYSPPPTHLCCHIAGWWSSLANWISVRKRRGRQQEVLICIFDVSHGGINSPAISQSFTCSIMCKYTCYFPLSVPLDRWTATKWESWVMVPMGTLLLMSLIIRQNSWTGWLEIVWGQETRVKINIALGGPFTFLRTGTPTRG